MIIIEISNYSLICGKPIIGILDIVHRVQDNGIRNVSVQFDKGEKVEDPFKDCTVIPETLTLKSALAEDTLEQLKVLADALYKTI